MMPSKIFTPLAFAGTIPFVLSVIFLLNGVKELPILGNIEQILTSYGLLIVSFMAGCHWGMNIPTQVKANKSTVVLPVASNVITLVAWFGYILLSSTFILALFILCFLALLVIDWYLYYDEKISESYFKIRLWVTMIVVLSLLVSMILTIFKEVI